VDSEVKFEIHVPGEEVYTGRRETMTHLGLDIGTKNIVLCYRKSDGFGFITEVNGYYTFEVATPFVENMLKSEDRVRSDGTKRAAKYIKLPESNKLLVLGADAEALAYSKNDTLQRPMAEGGVTGDEEALTVLASIVQDLLEMAENELGKFDKEVKLCYCTTAKAINAENNIDYHKKIVDLIIEGYESKAKITTDSIKESHAIVLRESEDGSGIGISWGAGSVTVSFVFMGVDIFSFCWVGSGDWIDLEVARRHGYNPDTLIGRRSKETPTTIAKRKHTIDLTPGKSPTDRVGLDITLHYQILVSKVVQGIIAGFNEHRSEARVDAPINVYLAGGTASPPGFEKLVELAFKEQECPFEIALITKSKNPLYAVAEGCLLGAELS
jgi:hypothetical protein